MLPWARAPATSYDPAVRTAFLALRLGGAAAIVVAIVGQLTNVISYFDDNPLRDESATIVNFFSYFTIDSNILAVVVLLIGAWRLARRLDDSPAYALLRAGAVTYMAITGTVYNLLLRNVELVEGLGQAWSNEIVHVVGPVVMVVDWLFAPGRRRLEWRHVGVLLAFPVVWTAYTMIRGPHVDDPVLGADSWYPYPFLNPDEFATGYGGVAFFLVLIGVAFAAVSLLVVWVSRRNRPPSAPVSAPSGSATVSRR